MRRLSISLLLLALSPLANPCEAGGKDKKTPAKEDKKDYLFVVPPAGGKEVKLVDWRFTLGTRKFSLSETPGPEYLEIREEKSTTYRNGILTLIPLNSVKKITYDRAKKGIAVIALQANGDETTLVGHTKFTSNKITIEADAILDGLGSATVKFNGGTDKGLHSVIFPAPKPAAKVEGAQATVIADDKEKSQHPAYDIQALYLTNGQYRVLPYIMFKKTVKVDLAKLAGLRYVPPVDKKKASSDYEITLKDGAKHTLSLLTTIAVDKKKMTFVGLVGRVPVGYRLFMLDAIYEYRAAEEKKE
ncbi:MAG: hypothetical protein HYX68_17350 [Planctomycetes bacterium]|jgi:hypothetical protein|nr:hypothetical protein [Planctomycetota bacterium]